MGFARIRSARGPSSYSPGGFTVTLGDVERIASGTGNTVAAFTVSSSPFVAQVVNFTGNIVTIILRDLRSGGIEATSGDFSGTHIAVVYEGV